MIFVTGGTGLVGSHLLFNLVSKGLKVRALKRENSNVEEVRKLFNWYSSEADVLFRQIEWVGGDILDIFSLEPVLKDVEIIYHCAAMVSFENRKRSEMIHNNVDGTANLVNAALTCGVKRICHISSNSALGKAPEGLPVIEETNWIPVKRNSGYSVSKFFSEAEIWRGVAEGLNAVVVNPSVIIGPGNWEKGSSRFFPVINKGMRFYTRGITGFVDVRDVADAIVLLTGEENFAKSKNQKFLLNGDNLEYSVLFNLIADALHKPRPSIPVSGLVLGITWRAAAFWSFLTGVPAAVTKETAAVSTRRNIFDGSKITRMFNFTYRPIRQAVQHTAVCYLRDIQNNQA